MDKALIIDDAKKHITVDLPDDVHLDQVYLHIGIFLGWIIDRELFSDMFEEECETQIYRFKTRDTSCVILGELWDGLIFDGQFTKPEGHEFTDYYYKSGMYLMDFKKVLAVDLPSIFYVEDTWENYQLMKAKIDERFEEWEVMHAAKEAVDATVKKVPNPLKKDNTDSND